MGQFCEALKAYWREISCLAYAFEMNAIKHCTYWDVLQGNSSIQVDGLSCQCHEKQNRRALMKDLIL